MADHDSGTVLVVGAGVGGIKAAIDLAERGCRVLLAEASPALGGILSRLDYQFPNNHCGLCRMLPAWERDASSEYCLRKGLFHENIRILPMTELTAVEGEAGRFEVTLRTRHRGVDPGACIGCGRCEEVCPVEVDDAFNEGLSRRKAVYREVPHNVPFSYVIDFEACTRCGECEEACPTEAITLKGEGRDTTHTAGAVILAPGCGLYDPSAPDAYGFGTLPDVITSLELERLLSGTGPTGGRILRPSNGEPARRVAWIQCVGSRNPRQGRDFCSSICCMFALKETLLVKERFPDVETAVFYMDMRAYGKEGYRYQLRAEVAGTEMIPCRVHAVEPGPDGLLYLRHYLEEAGEIRERPFDLVVLSTGQASTPEMQRLSEIAGVPLNPWGFAGTRGADPADTGRPGIYWCGSASGLQDITETVLQAEAAACRAALDAGQPPAPTENHSDPEVRDVSRQIPRVGVLLCRCLGGQGHDLPWDDLLGDLRNHPDVALVLEGDRLCRADGFDEAWNRVRMEDLNRLVVGACTPYVYDRRLHRLGAGLALQEDLVEVVDLRAAGLSPGDAEEKRRLAVSILSSAALKLKYREFPKAAPVSVVQELVVVGGGLAGMTAALAAADHGIRVRILERGDALGGLTPQRRYTLDGLDPVSLARDLKARIEGHDRIEVRLRAELTGLSGEPGRFSATILEQGNEETLACGAVVLATGGSEAETQEYGFGRSERILRQGDLEARLGTGEFRPEDLGRIVMIQCVGSRSADGRAYCSRICCASALKNASRILELRPDADIFVLYRDLMSYGFMESHYHRLREQGVQFIRYLPGEPPEAVVEDDRVLVRFHEPILGRLVEVHPDLLVLSTGVVPSDNRSLARRLGVELNEDGFFQEMDPKWRPVDLCRPGVFACGLAHSPRNMAETMVQARAASMRAVNLLGKPAMRTSRTVSDVHHALCSLCETCISACPFQARVREKDRIRVIGSACQGCGICVAACPNGAAWLPLSTDRQTMGMLEGMLENAYPVR